MALAWEPTGLDHAFWDVYGSWAPLTPAQVGDLMAGFPHPWRIAGGYAIEAYTGIDLVVFADHVPDLQRHLGHRYHLWSNHGGTFRVIDDAQPEPLHPLAQVWLRENAHSPWAVDISPSPRKGGLWQSRRHEDFVAPLDDVTWVHSDRVRYVNPEVALLFKANQPVSKNDVDFANTCPFLSAEKRVWLLEALQRWNPGHKWIDRLR